MTITISHNSQARRFEAEVDSMLSVCDYRRDGDVVVMHHTEVPPALNGRGIAGQLVAAALTWVRAEGLRVRPSCSYVAAYMQRHPETLDLHAAKS
ncbi:MAG: GNAT family N-acetyltransferase [Acidobacteriota bacterium]